MKKTTYKTKALKLFLLFLAIMSLMSVISRGIYTSKIPKVSAASMINQSIGYTFQCSGSLKTSRELPIYVIPDLRVEEIYVRQGDFIKEEDALLRYDKTYLKRCINQLKNEIEIDRLTRLDYGKAQAWNSIKILDISTTEKQKRLNTYQALLENGAEIFSDRRGFITDVKIISGDFTKESAAFSIADATANLYFSANITEDDTEHIGIGDLVPLKFRNGKKTISDCEITAIYKSDTEDGYQLEIAMEQSELKIGEIGTIEVTILSEKQYDCIPLEAVHASNSSTNARYVYVIEESEGFFGKEYHVIKKNIEVVQQNDNYAAIENSGISIEDKIVLHSNQDLFDGDIVRLYL